MREDLRLLRRDTSTTAATGFDDTLNLPRNYVSRDDDYAYGGTHRRYRDGYNTAANDDLLEVRRSRTFLDGQLKVVNHFLKVGCLSDLRSMAVDCL